MWVVLEGVCGGGCLGGGVDGGWGGGGGGGGDITFLVTELFSESTLPSLGRYRGQT